MYAILMKKGSSKLDDIASSADDLTATTTNSTPAQDNYAGTLRDECTAFELAKYNDEADMVIVEKRDPESAAPVRVHNGLRYLKRRLSRAMCWKAWSGIVNKRWIE